MSTCDTIRSVEYTNEKVTPIKVLLWSRKGAGLHYGGYATTAYRLYSRRSPQRIALTLAHGLVNHDAYELFDEQVSICDSWSNGRIALWDFISKGKRWMKKNAHRFDVFHGLQSYEHTVSPACVAKKAGLPTALKLAGHKAGLATKPNLQGWLGFPRRRRRRVSQLDSIIAISNAIRDELLSYDVPESKIACIPNGVETATFYPGDSNERQQLRQEFGWPDCPIVLFVGIINQRKQPGLLVEAMGHLAKKGVDCKLILAGPIEDQEYAAEMKSKAEEMSVSQNVVWTGMSDRVPDFYRAADVFCLPSRNEGMPNAVLEAMATRLPCLVTPISGSVDLIEDGVNGRIIDFSPAEIADAITAYVDDPSTAKAHGQKSLEIIHESYSTTRVLEAHENLFRRIMAGKDAASASIYRT